MENTFRFRPGWIIRDRSNATGGVHYTRELIEEHTSLDMRQVTDHKTRKTVDNVEIVHAMDSLVKRVDYVLRKHCTRTEIGCFADDVRLAKVRTEVDELKLEAVQLNKKAAKANSKRRVQIDVVPLKLDLAQPEAVKEIAATVRGVLTALRDALRCGDVASIHKLKIRAINLEQLAVGIQSDIIRFAVERALQAASEIKTAIRGAGDKSTRQAARLAGRDLDLDAIEAAIAHFTSQDALSDANKGKEEAA
jgi:hypothetical protein